MFKTSLVSLPIGQRAAARLLKLTRSFCLLFLTLSGFFIALLGIAPARAELIHQWTFDSNLTDSVGSWDGTASGAGATVVTGGGAHQGSGYLSLDGSGYVTLGEVTMPGNFTISAWMWVDPVSDKQTLIANAPEGSPGFFIYVNNYLQTNRIVIADTRSADNDAGLATPNDQFGLNNWHNITFTANRSAGLGSIYYDGVLVAGPSTILTDFALTGILNIGAFGDGSNTLQGKIDDLSIYNTVLSQSEVQALVNGGEPAAVPEPGTWAAAALLVGGAAFVRWRKRI